MAACAVKLYACPVVQYHKYSMFINLRMVLLDHVCAHNETKLAVGVELARLPVFTRMG